MPDATCTQCNGTGSYRSTYNTEARCRDAQFKRVVAVRDLSIPLRTGALITADGTWHERSFDATRWVREPADAWTARLTTLVESLHYVTKWSVHTL